MNCASPKRSNKGQQGRFHSAVAWWVWLVDAIIPNKSETEGHPSSKCRWPGMSYSRVLQLGFTTILFVCVVWLTLQSEENLLVEWTAIEESSGAIVAEGMDALSPPGAMIPEGVDPLSSQDSDPLASGATVLERAGSLSPYTVPQGADPPEGSGRDYCSGKRLYVYNMPAKFNKDIVRTWNKYDAGKFAYLWKLKHFGMGYHLNDGAEDVTDELLVDPKCWFNTATYTVEYSYHMRLLQHPCRTKNPETADIFYVPFYAALDMERFSEVKDFDVRNRLSYKAAGWLNRQRWVNRHGGHDHFMVVGHTGYAFRIGRKTNFGSNWLTHNITQNFTKLTFDRDMWDLQFTGIPYPTSFHPSTEQQLRDWQEHIRRLNRSMTVAFAGSKERHESGQEIKETFAFRDLLMRQCEAWDQCSLLDCNLMHTEGKSPCRRPITPLRMYKDAKFCLHPRGDTPSRKSTFDAMLAGCIPVFFSPESAYNHYHWYLPLDPASYSVLIDESEVRTGLTTVEEVLSKYTSEQIEAMRNVVIDDIIPRIILANIEDNRLDRTRDAVDRAVEGMAQLVARYKGGHEIWFPTPWQWEHRFKYCKEMLTALFPPST